MAPEWASIVGAVVGALITLFASYGFESFREKQRNEKRRTSIARTIASEIYFHSEAVEALLKGTETIKTIREKFTDFQWQQYQNELWGLDPLLGVLFRKYYNELENMKTGLNHNSKLEKEFAPLMELAKECLRKADFPMRKGGAVASVIVSTETRPESKSKKD